MQESVAFAVSVDTKSCCRTLLKRDVFYTLLILNEISSKMEQEFINISSQGHCYCYEIVSAGLFWHCLEKVTILGGK